MFEMGTNLKYKPSFSKFIKYSFFNKSFIEDTQSCKYKEQYITKVISKVINFVYLAVVSFVASFIYQSQLHISYKVIIIL